MIHELVRALVTATGAENAATSLDTTKIAAHPPFSRDREMNFGSRFRPLLRRSPVTIAGNDQGSDVPVVARGARILFSYDRK